MLKTVFDNAPDAGAGDVGGASSLFRLADLVATLRRQWPLIVMVTGAMVALAFIYLVLATARYTATSAVMLNTRKTQLVQQQAVIGDLQIDPAVIDSQVELLKSESVGLKVIRTLKLTEDPEFTDPGRLARVLDTLAGPLRLIGLADASLLSEDRKERLAFQYFDRNLKIKRVGTSYVMEVSFTSQDAAKAARVSNGIVDAYMVGELDARFDATKRANQWLQQRIDELRVQATAADAAVQQFKRDNNIIDTGRGLISEQQLGDVNAQLPAASAGVAEARARLDRIEEVLAGDPANAAVAEVIRSDVITRLRSQYLDVTSRAAEIARRVGERHQSVQQLRGQAEDIKRSIGDEVKRIAATTRSDYEIATTRLAALKANLDSMIGQANLTGEAQVRLRALESASQTYRNLYDTFLQRFMETAQQQSFAIDEARVITAATEPTEKSWPRPLLTLAGALLLGGLCGAGSAVAREALDERFRTTAQVAEATGLPSIGILPLLPPRTPLPNARPADAASRRLADDAGLLRYSVDEPFTRFAEALRAAKVAIDIAALSRPTQVVGIVSALPQEGKTTVAVNLAQAVAHAGARVILIDADLRNPSLTRRLVPEARTGLVEVLRGKLGEGAVVWTDPVSGLHVLPAVLAVSLSHTSELISSRAMAALLARLRQHYDYVFLDLPPAAPIVDVRAVGGIMDAFLMVVEWGRTHKTAVIETIAADACLQAKALGILLNKADKAELRRIESYKGPYHDKYCTDIRERA